MKVNRLNINARIASHLDVQGYANSCNNVYHQTLGKTQNNESLTVRKPALHQYFHTSAIFMPSCLSSDEDLFPTHTQISSPESRTMMSSSSRSCTKFTDLQFLLSCAQKLIVMLEAIIYALINMLQTTHSLKSDSYIQPEMVISLYGSIICTKPSYYNYVFIYVWAVNI